MIFAGERQLRGSGGGKEQEERMMMQKMEEGGAGAEVGALVGMLSASRAEEASSWQEVGRLLHAEWLSRALSLSLSRAAAGSTAPTGVV